MHICPNPECGQKTFTRYIDTITEKYIDENVGICSRKDKCGHHYPPHQYFKDNPDMKTIANFTGPEIAKEIEDKGPSYIDKNVLQRTLKKYTENNFVGFLRAIFSDAKCKELIGLYHLGTASQGRTVFWQIDKNDKIRAGKIMLYDQETGKREKKASAAISWAHTNLNLKTFKLVQCFFGERLLKKFPNKPVAIFESEKTAVIVAGYFPDFVCLASGGKDGLTIEKCKTLKGREVYLFPDLKATDAWVKTAHKCRHIVKMTVSLFLEQICNASQREDGYDMADYLILQQLNTRKNSIISDKPTRLHPYTRSDGQAQSISNQPETTLNYENGVSINATEPKVTRSNLSKIGRLKLTLYCRGRGESLINIYLFYRLIIAKNQNDISHLFSTNISTPWIRSSDRITNLSNLEDLKNDGGFHIKEGYFATLLYHKSEKTKLNVYSGLMTFSIPTNYFKSAEALYEAKEKIKSLQNVALLYTDASRYKDELLNLMVYFGKLPEYPDVSPGSGYHTSLEGYEERWSLYAEYLRKNIEYLKGNPYSEYFWSSPSYSLVLASDPDAWLNPNDSGFTSWQHFLSL